MKSLKRLFGRKSARKVNRRLPFRLSRPIGYASHVERLEDRTLLASNILASLESSVNQPNDTTDLVLNVGTGSSPTLGFEVRAAANSTFDPAAIRIFDANTNAVIPLTLSENDSNGSTNSLVLATLDPGEFRIEVQGQTSATGSFIVDVFLPGDSDASGSVSDTEYRHALAASYQHLFGFNNVTAHVLIQRLGLDPATSFYSEEMDGDKDGDVDNEDLQYMNSNRNIPAVQFELIGDQDPPQFIAGLQIDSGVSNSDGITNDLTILGNISDESLIAQFKVGLDGAALVDFVDILPQVSGGANGGSFTLTRSWLETNLNGGNSLEGGTHTLSFFAEDEHGNNNINSFFDVTFVLDATAPTLTGTQIGDEVRVEDFSFDAPINLGSKPTFFNQNGGTALSYQFDSITNPIVTLDSSANNLLLNSILNANGSTDIAIRATDLAGNSVISNTFNVLVNAVNDAPVAVDDAFTTDEDTLLNGGSNVFAANPTTPDSDVENDAFTVTEVNGNSASVGNQITLSSGALLTLNSDGTFTYNPNGAFDSLADGQSDTDSFTYTIDDGTGGVVTTDTATVTITINGVNDDPTAGDEGVAATEDGSTVTTSVLADDVDSDDDANSLIYSITAQPSEGTASSNGDGTFTFDPGNAFQDLAQDDTRQVTFTYTATDSHGAVSNTGTVTVTVTGVNDDPTAGDEGIAATEDGSSVTTSVLTDDVDSDDDANSLNYAITLQPTEGTASSNGDGTFTFDPGNAFQDLAQDDTRQVTFTYTATDSHGAVSNTGTVTVTVTGVNDDPTAGDEGIAATEDGSSVTTSVLTDDVDSDDDANSLIYSITAQPSEGTASSNGDGTFTFDPGNAFQDLAEDDTRQVTFTYTATDSHGAVSNTGTVTVTVTGVNDDPTAANSGIAAMEDGNTVGGSFGGDDVDTDDDVNSLTYAITSQPSEGSVVNDNDGTFTFDPGNAFQDLAQDDTRQVTFTYTATDSHGAVSNTGTVTVTVTGVNDDPTATDDSLNATEDGSSVTTSVLTDDVDSDDDANSLNYSITAQPSEGTASSNGDGTFTFDPGNAFQDLAVDDTRQVTFTYTATDSHGAVSNTGTVTVTVTGVNDDPTAANSGIAAMEDGNTVGGSFGGDDVDTDDDVNSLTYAITAQPSEGSVVNDNDGTFTFDPGNAFQDLAQDDTRQVTFTYTATDSHGAVSNTGTVTVTVTGVNDDPTAGDEGIAATEDGSSVTTSVLTDDVDSDDDANSLNYSITAQPSEGTASSNGDGTFTFDPGNAFQDLAEDDTRQVTFTYTATDSHGAVSNTGTVTVTVTGVNDDPTAGDEGIAATEDGSSVTTSVLTDDVDSDDDANSLIYSITAQPSEGTASSNGDGTFTFDPGNAFQDLADGDTRQVTFTYTATDSHGAVSNTGTVTVTVTGVNDDPTAGDEGIAATEDGSSVTTSVLTDDVDSDDDANSLIYSITAQPSEGTASSNGDGTFTFDPGNAFQDLAQDDTRQVTFTYTATDSHGAVSNTGTVTVTVTGVNDDPTAGDEGIAATEDGSSVTTSVLTDDVDSDDDANSLIYSITAQPSEGTASSNDDGTFTFDPGNAFQDLADGDTRQVTFTYTATDQHGAVSNTGTVTVTVTGVNDDPTAIDDAVDVNKDFVFDGDVFANNGNGADFDIDIGDDFTVTAVTGGINPVVGSQFTLDSGALLTIRSNGTFSYDPNGQFAGLSGTLTATDSFQYTIDDGKGGTDVATVTVTISANQLPVADPDNGGTTDEETAINNIAVLTNDTDPDGDDGNLVVSGLPSLTSTGGAALSLNPDGTINYDPSGAFDFLALNGQTTDTFTYTVQDERGGESTGTVTVTVNGVNDDPTAGDEGIAATEDGSSVTTSVLTDDVDSDDDANSLIYSITAQPSEGTASSNGDGTFTFDPGNAFQDLAQDDTRQVTFTYTATDSHGAVSNTGTVTVTVTGVNDDPTAGDEGIAATEDGSSVTTSVLTDDVDSDDDANSLIYSITAQPSEGTASSNGDGTFTFDPGNAFQDLAQDDTRQVTFTYTATDSHGAVSNTGTVTVTVTGVNDDPTAGDEGIAATEDGSSVTTSVLTDDVDSDDDANSLIYSITAQPSEGTASSNGDGTFTFDPGNAFQDLAEDDTRQVTFTYTATDSHGAVSNTGTVTVTVTGVNDDPTAANSGIAAMEDGNTVGGSFGGDDVDTDDDVNSLTYAITSQPSEGSVVNDNDGTFTFDPGNAFQDLAQDDTRQVTFTYTATDSHGAVSNTGTVTVTVTGVNDDPTAGDEGIAATEDGSSVTTSVLTDDVDSDDDANSLIYSITAQPSEGTASSNGDGTFTFDPGNAFQDLAEDDTRQVTFTYTATDSHGAVSNTGTVTVTVTGVNDDPTAANSGIAAMEDGNTVGGSFGGDDVDTDDDVNSLTYAITSQPSEGSVVNDNDGTFTFDPGNAFQDLAQDDTRQVTFTYTATDSHGAVSNTGTVTVTVTGVNDDPTAGDEGIAATEDGSSVTTSVLTDDVDSDDDANSLIYSITAQPSEGTASSNGDGTFTFDPGNAFQDLAEDDTRQVTFTYTATDSHGAVSNTGTVTVTVTGVNDDPTAANSGIAAMEDGNTVGGSFGGDDVDTDDDVNSLTYAITSQPSEGSVVNDNDGTFTFDPGNAFQDLAQDDTRQVTFTYTATDSHGAVSNTGTVTVTVTGVNDDPTAGDEGIAATEDGSSVTTSVLTDDVDSDDDANSLNYSITVQPSEGTASSNGDGTFTFDPGNAFQDLAQDDTRQVTFTYTATDSHGAVSNTGTVTVTVTGVNDDPTAGDEGIAATEDGSSVTTSVLTDDVDSDDDANSLIYSITAQPSEGTASSNGDGTFTFDPGNAFQDLAQDETRQVTFTYTATDSHGAVSNTGTVTVTVTGVNDPVTANDDAVTTDRNTAITFDVRFDDPSGTVADTDPDTSDTHTVIMIDNQVVNLGDTITLAGSVVQVTLELDGTITYNPNGEFDDLLLPTSTEDDTFEYKVTDGNGSTDTGTVTVTVTGTNEELMIKDGLPDISRDGLTTTVIDLTDVFKDDDPGDTISYEVVPTTLANGDPLPANIWVDTVSIAGVGSDQLHITYNPYSSGQVRLPVKITVKATSSDGVSAPVETSFILTPDPQQTVDIQLMARSTAASGRDFTYFRAENFGSPGAGLFHLVNGSQDLEYKILLKDYLPDIDHSDNTTTDDDLRSVRIVDSANPSVTLFTIFDFSLGDDNPTIDLANLTLSGTWSSSEGLSSAIIDKLYNGELVVKVEFDGNGGVSDLGGENIFVSPEVDQLSDLPAVQNEFVVGDTYVVEVWLSDQLAQQILAGSTSEVAGILSAQLDLLWDDTTAASGQDFLLDNGEGFFSLSVLFGGIINNSGVINDIQGLTLVRSDIDGGYVRLGIGVFTADAATADGDPVEYTVDSAGDGVLDRGSSKIDFSQISINDAVVTHVAPSEFFIQTDQSNLTVTGTVTVPGSGTVNLVKQSGTLDTTDMSGRFKIVVDDFNNPTSIRIVDSAVEINPAGNSIPNRDALGGLNDLDLADFGLMSDTLLAGSNGLLNLAIRDAIANVFSSTQSIDGSGLFDISEEWTLTNGQVDSLITLPNEFVISRNSESTDGLPLEFFVPASSVPFGLPSWDKGRLRETAPSSGIFVLEIPISRRLSYTDATGALVELNYEGSVSATFNTNQADQFGDTIGTAHDTQLNSTTPETKVFQGVIGNNSVIADPLSDVDMFQVQLNDGDQVIVDVDADMFGTGLDSVVRIFDATGTQVAFSDDATAPDEFYLGDSTELDSFVTFTNNTGSAATFFIGVSAFNNTDDPASYDATDTAGRPTGVLADDVGSYDLTITVETGAPPLQGTESVTTSPELTEGTAVDLVVVRNQTDLDSSGSTAALPASDSWIDEWSSFWVEIYVETADAKGVTEASVDLNYNTNFFTATDIEFSNAFADSGNAVVNDATGVVTTISGTANSEKAGNQRKTLLARVKFESLEQDDVSINFEDKFIGPHALGLSLNNVTVSLADDTATSLTVSDAPETDLWAIAYDVNDDDAINFQDLVQLASVYGENVLDADSPYVWALDFDKSGTVNFKDLKFFVNNYGVTKGGDQDVIYPSNFLQRWYGQTTDITGDSTIDEVMDVALGMWQDALGLEQPLDIQLVITDLGGTQLGEGQITAVDEEGRPIAGIVTIDDDAAGLGWYSSTDTSAFGGIELEGGVAYTADGDSDAAGHYDLLTVLLHEIGHVAGFTRTYAPFESHLETGVGGTLMFVGSGFEAALTNDGLHLDETVHAGDVMNATLAPGVRKLPSELDTLILQTAHETAANGNFEIQVGVNAPLMADLPLITEYHETIVEHYETVNEHFKTVSSAIVSNIEEHVAKIVEPFVALDPILVEVSNSLEEWEESVHSSLDLARDHFELKLSALADQVELDLSVLEDLKEEFHDNLHQNGLAIVGYDKFNKFGDFDLEDLEWDLPGLREQLETGFDDVFSDWAGPIL